MRGDGVGGHELELRLRVLRPGVEVVQFLGEKVAAGLIVAVTFPLMNVLHINPLGAWPVWLWLVGFGVGFLLPDWDLDRRERLRRGLVLTELPTILDMLTLATSAGMALEQALEEVARHSQGVVAQELPDAKHGMNVVDSPREIRRNLPHQHGGLAGEHQEGGIGRLIFTWGESYQVPELLAGILLISVLTVAVNEAMRLAELRVSRFHARA